MKSVDAGAAFLDEYVPGWIDMIDLDTLNLSEGSRCVLGQIYLHKHPHTTTPCAAYHRQAIELGLVDERWPRFADDSKTGRLGFMEFGRSTFKSLTDAWRKLILARRKEQPV